MKKIVGLEKLAKIAKKLVEAYFSSNLTTIYKEDKIILDKDKFMLILYDRYGDGKYRPAYLRPKGHYIETILWSIKKEFYNNFSFTDEDIDDFDILGILNKVDYSIYISKNFLYFDTVKICKIESFKHFLNIIKTLYEYDKYVIPKIFPYIQFPCRKILKLSPEFLYIERNLKFLKLYYMLSKENDNYSLFRKWNFREFDGHSSSCEIENDLYVSFNYYETDKIEKIKVIKPGEKKEFYNVIDVYKYVISHIKK